MQSVVTGNEGCHRALILLNHVSVHDRADILSVLCNPFALQLLSLLPLHQLLSLVLDIELVDDSVYH